MDDQTTSLITDLAEALAAQLLWSYTRNDVCHMPHMLKILCLAERKLKKERIKVPYAVSEVLRLCKM